MNKEFEEYAKLVLLEDETFNASNIVKDKYIKLLFLQKEAFRLKECNGLFFNCEYEFDKLDGTKRDSFVIIDLNMPSGLDSEISRTIFCNMISVSDEISIAFIKEKNVLRVTFIIDDLFI